MKRTDKVLLAATAVLIAYEGYTVVNDEEGDTISETVWEATKRRPLIPFALGFLCGHFFWQKAERAAEKAVEAVKDKIDG